MNERIQELVKQAEDYADYFSMLSGDPEKEIFVEKFAEMLAQDAIKVVQRRYMGDNNREDMEVRRCVEDLKKHFGVES